RQARELRDAVDEATGLLRQPEIVALAGEAKLLLDRVVGQAADEPRFAQRRLAAVGRDLVGDPFQVFACAVGFRQRIDRVLHRDGAELLEAPPDLHPKVVRAWWDRVDEQDPAGGRVRTGRRRIRGRRPASNWLLTHFDLGHDALES